MAHMYMYVITAHADDDNCIALKPLPEAEDCQGDYINACYVMPILILPISHHTTHIAHRALLHLTHE